MFLAVLVCMFLGALGFLEVPQIRQEDTFTLIPLYLWFLLIQHYSVLFWVTQGRFHEVYNAF